MAEGGGRGITISSIPVGFDREGRPIRFRRRRREYDPIDAILYPIADGPGVALLIFLPPLLAVMTLPVIDVFTEITVRNALSLIHAVLLPIATPLLASFAMLSGYVALFLGRVLAASAFGEDPHPRWPAWDRVEILEGLGRWIWASLMGVAVGGFPAVAYWIRCGEVDAIDLFLFGDLAAIGLAYALMALAIALLHENLISANPAAVVSAIARVGWDYVGPCILATLGFGSAFFAWRFVIFRSPGVIAGMLGLWLSWVWTLYQAMVVFRVLGLVYHKHDEALGWFRRAPRWGA